MRFLFLGVLVFSLLSPACERVNPPSDQHDARPVQPPDGDAGSATDGGTGPDARTPRPGAGPLDPDLTIPCEETTARVLRDEMGNITSRFVETTAAWSEDELPLITWVCYSQPLISLTCDGVDRCTIEGDPVGIKCIEIRLMLNRDGRYLHRCALWSETDSDGDGVFEGMPEVYRDMYLAVVQ